VEGSLQQIVGRSLRAYRETQGLSQEAFADVLGMHRTYLGGIERGEHNLTLRSVERIAGRISLEPMALLNPGEPADAGSKQRDVSLSSPS
jgi:transcriptional regulator with XRE-family HTH domain